MTKRAIVLAAGCSSLLFGCGDLQRDRTEDVQETVDNLIQAGYPAGDIMVVDGVVYAGRDAEVSLQASREMLGAGDSSKEQYRTTNLVSRDVTTICVDGTTFTGTEVFDTALNAALANYNTLQLTFRMVRTSGGATGCNATITALTVTGTGSSSGFPKGGTPFDTITIGSELGTLGVTTLTHVITHELGHTIGLRHSDFFDTSISCGKGGNEGDLGVGAILIPGTPSGATVGGSVMNTCFRTVESGKFTDTDVIALTTLYR